MKGKEIIDKILNIILSSLVACLFISFLLLTSCVSKSSAPVSPTTDNGNSQTTVISSILPSQQAINPSSTNGWQKMIVNYSYSVSSQIGQGANIIEPDPGSSFVLFNLDITNYGHSDIQVDPSYFSLTINQVQYSADDQDVLPYPLTMADLPDGGISGGQLLFQVPTDVAYQPGSINYGGYQSINVLWITQGPPSQNLELPRLTLK
jgi:hypothetical protein